MKKNILNKILIIVIILSAWSCTDLEEEPIGIMAPESYFKTETDVEAAVFGAYYKMANRLYFGRKYTIAVNLLGDACDIGDLGTPARRISMNNLQADANNGLITEFWPQIYQTIAAASAAVKGAETIADSDKESVIQLKAEATLIRAYCYYNLVRLFGDIPFINEFVTEPSAVDAVSKTPVAEIYESIIADCEYAVENLPDNYENDIRCRPTAGSAKTMLASIYLTLGDYAKAAEYAEDVIAHASTYGYELVDDFTQLWVADNGDMAEHVWTVDFLAGVSVDYWGALTGVRNADKNGWSVVVPSPGFYDMYDEGDYRMETTFITETEVGGVMTPYTGWTWPRIHFGKYCLYVGANANADGIQSGRNYPIFRFAEVYLIAAEALAEVNNGPTDKCYEYVNKIRERARHGGTVPANLETGMSKDQFIDAVLKERLLEFPLEYKRWYDIKRRDLGAEVFEGPNSMEPHDFDPTKKYLLPLPQDELDRNPNLLPQNAGY